MASLGDVQQTFSSWDSCMSKAYCKWPVVAAIIVGSLVLLSVIFCIARCLCFGAECCACCFSCLSCCCPGRRKRSAQGYENYNQPPPPAPYGQYPQYSSPPAPLYSQPSPYQGPRTAAFESTAKPQATARYNEDALPAMPSWNTSTTRHVEEEPVEMDRLGNTHLAQQQHLLAGEEQDPFGQQGYTQPQSPQGYQGGHSQGNQGYAQPQSPQGHQSGYARGNQGYAPSVSDYAPSTQYAGQYRGQQHAYAGDLGNMSATPYHDYNDHRQYAPSMSPVSTTAYAPSTAVPPSYHTREPSVVSPIQGSFKIPDRRPVQGSWRDV